MIDHGTVFMPHLLELLLMVFFLHFCRPRMSVRVVNHSALPVRLLDLLLVSASEIQNTITATILGQPT